MKATKVLSILLAVSALIFFIMRQPKTTVVQFVDGPAVSVEIADDWREQAQGLSGHAPLDDGHGMLFVWPSRETRTFWMKDMTFAIDMLWIADGQVIGIEQSVQPPADDNTDETTLPLYHSPAPADQVLEVAAGFSLRHGIAVGDRLTVSE